MFVSPSTGYEWRFQLFGIPVEVQPFFWIVGLVVIGEDAYKWTQASTEGGNPFATMLVTLVMFFLSILIHELGHVLAFRFYGIHSRILLHGLGGLAIPTTQTQRANRRSRWREVVVAAAGPAMETLMVILPVVGMLLIFGTVTPEAAQAGTVGVFFGINWLVVLFLTIYMNVFWIIFNLLPILPMDGGRISEGLCKDFLGPYRGYNAALIISIFTGILVVIWAYKTGNTFLALFVAYMTFQSLQALQGNSGRW